MDARPGDNVPAGFLRRAAAYLIDSLVVTLLWGLAFVILCIIAAVFDPQGEDSDTYGAILLVAAPVLWFFHQWICNTTGASIGKKRMSLSVRHCPEGARPGVGRGLVRTVGQVLGVLPLGLGFWWALWGDQSINVFLSVSSFAERMVVPENTVVRVREDALLDKLSIMGCAVATGVGAVLNTARVEVGSSVAVIGVGGVGLSVVQGAALAAAYPIIAIDVLGRKLEMAQQFGATHFVNASEKDPVEAVCALTGGGADYAFEVIGKPEAISQAFDMVHAGGEAIMVGVSPFGSKTSIDTNGLLAEKVLRGCVYGSIRQRVDLPRCVDLYMAGRLKLDELISRTFSLEGINDAFAAMKAGEVARSVIVF